MAFWAAARGGQSGPKPIVVIGEWFVFKLGFRSHESRLVAGAITRCPAASPTTSAAWTLGTVGVCGTLFLGVYFRDVFVNRCELVQRLARRRNSIPIPIGTGCTRGFFCGQTIKEVIGETTFVAFKDGRGRFAGPFCPSRAILSGGAFAPLATSTRTFLTGGGWLGCRRRILVPVSSGRGPSGRGLVMSRAIPTGTLIARAIPSCGASRSGRGFRASSFFAGRAFSTAAGVLISTGATTVGTVAARPRSAIPFVRSFPVPAFQGVPEVVLLVGGLWLGSFGIPHFYRLLGIGILQILVIECGVCLERCRSTPSRLRTDIVDNVVVIIRDIDIGWRSFFELFPLIIVVKRIKQPDAESIVIIITRNLQSWHRLACPGGSGRSCLSNGLCRGEFFLVRLGFLDGWLSHCHRGINARGFRCGGGSQSPEVQTVQVVRVIHGTTGRKVNSEKLLCQRLGGRLTAGTWRIGLVHNPLN